MLRAAGHGAARTCDGVARAAHAMVMAKRASATQRVGIGIARVAPHATLPLAVLLDGGAANAYIAELTKEVNGIPYLIEFACLEVPTGGDPDINLVCSATGTTAENAAVTSGTVLFNNGDLTLGLHNEMDAGSTL